MAAQNIYDDPIFFQGYAKLRHAEGGLNAALEWPAFQRLLPPLAGQRVLDLGCGMGNFARAAREMGAAEVVALDISERMLKEARARTSDSAITFIRGEIETIRVEDDAFDLVASSLTLHYVNDYSSVVQKVTRALKSGGRFAFSVEHPISTCCSEQSWAIGAGGERLYWPVDNYRAEGLRTTKWFVDDVIKYHRTIETYVNELLAAGLRLVRLEEPEPAATFVEQRPELSDDRRRPPFLLLAADKP